MSLVSFKRYKKIEHLAKVIGIYFNFNNIEGLNQTKDMIYII